MSCQTGTPQTYTYTSKRVSELILSRFTLSSILCEFKCKFFRSEGIGDAKDGGDTRISSECGAVLVICTTGIFENAAIMQCRACCASDQVDL